ncbi:MAG: IS3 family transposase [Candidatus Goldiibacteriota bacterium]
MFVDPHDKNFSINRQCKLLGVWKSALYYEKRPIKDSDKTILDRIDEIYTECPFYGARKISRALYKLHGIKIGRKKTGSLMKIMGIEAICPKKSLSIPNKAHKKYPYLLKGLKIKHPNKVWATDITYIRLRKGYAYLVAVIDWHSRYVLSYRLSYSLDSSFCKEALLEALEKYGKPQYFNTDQGSQFTDKTFTEILEGNKIKISMDGRGRAHDNIIVERLWRSVKYDDVYPNGYETMFECEVGLKRYFNLYNNTRLHQSLDYRTPAEIYFAGTDNAKRRAKNVA